jgi:ABC-type transport system substrate-binding protein
MLDREQIIPKIKKYVLYISIVFFFSIFIHLIYLYLFSNSKNIALNGWSLSEAVIGEFPHLNPLVSGSDYNKYIIHALYRSLLRYDAKEKKFVGDITSCDIKNLQIVECFLNESIKWSDGTDITTKDIVSTFSLIKKTEVNPVISSLLSDTEVEDKGTSVVFRTKKSDINFLNIFLQPILSEKSINKLSEEEITWKFPIEWMLYSWPYTVDSVWQDENLWIKRLTLSKNKVYPEKEFIIDKIVFKIFNDTSHFLKHKDSINIFNDKTSLIGDTLPRLSVFDYTLPQYVSVFINSEKIQDTSLRRYLLSSIERENIIKLLWEKNFQEVKNPYLSDTSIDVTSSEKNIESLMKRSGYFKKEELAKEILDKAEIQIKQQGIPKAEIDITKQAKLVFSPSTTVYNFVSQDDVLLKWKVIDSDVQAVYVNDYKLKWFQAGDKEFIYRLKEAWYDTIKQWKNIYKIIFEKWGKKQLVDEVVYYFYKDPKKLEEEKQRRTTLPQQATTSTGSTTSIENNEERNKAIQKIDSLDGKFLYNRNLEKLSFTLLYADTDKYISDTAKSIQAQLEQAWVSINLEWVDVNQLNKKLLKWEKDYDLILVWVNLWYFENNIFPYFHSSQVKEWYNFSNFKKLWLDIALEDLKSSNMTQDKIMEWEKKVLNIIKQEAIVKTLYTPIMKQLVDKNIKNFSLTERLTDDTLRFDGLRDAYMLQKRIINYSEKSITGFFVYIWKSLFL